MYACNPRTWETEAGASGVQSETLGSVSSRSARTTDEGTFHYCDETFHQIYSKEDLNFAFWLMVVEILVHGHLAPLIVSCGNTEHCGREHGGAKVSTPSHVSSTRCTLQDHTQGFYCVYYTLLLFCAEHVIPL